MSDRRSFLSKRNNDKQYFEHHNDDTAPFDVEAFLAYLDNDFGPYTSYHAARLYAEDPRAAEPLHEHLTADYSNVGTQHDDDHSGHHDDKLALYDLLDAPDHWVGTVNDDDWKTE